MNHYNVSGISDWAESEGESFKIFTNKPFNSVQDAVAAAGAVYGDNLQVIVEKVVTLNKPDNFKKELKELLEKYNASIDVCYDSCSDMHGVYDEGIEVSFEDDNSSFKLVNDWYISVEQL